MNLILLDEHEIDRAGVVTLTGPRAGHLRGVLRVSPGDTVRVGMLGGPLGRAEVVASDDAGVRLCCRFESDVPARSEDTLILAIPRPRVLRRCLAHAAALGFGRILLVRSWCVDKSHLGARAVQPDAIERSLRAGLEQSRRTHLPTVSVHGLFRPFVEDRLADAVPDGARFVAHPDASTALAHGYAGRSPAYPNGLPVVGPTDTACRRAPPGAAGIPWRKLLARVQPTGAPITLALGPERGWIPYEVDMLAQRGFTPIQAGPHPLRVETALGFVYGQLTLLRALAVSRRS